MNITFKTPEEIWSEQQVQDRLTWANNHKINDKGGSLCYLYAADMWIWLMIVIGILWRIGLINFFGLLSMGGLLTFVAMLGLLFYRLWLILEGGGQNKEVTHKHTAWIKPQFGSIRSPGLFSWRWRVRVYDEYWKKADLQTSISPQSPQQMEWVIDGVVTHIRRQMDSVTYEFSTAIIKTDYAISKLKAIRKDTPDGRGTQAQALCVALEKQRLDLIRKQNEATDLRKEVLTRLEKMNVEVSEWKLIDTIRTGLDLVHDNEVLMFQYDSYVSDLSAIMSGMTLSLESVLELPEIPLALETALK